MAEFIAINNFCHLKL